jgi:hypothetical protein
MDQVEEMRRRPYRYSTLGLNGNHRHLKEKFAGISKISVFTERGSDIRSGAAFSGMMRTPRLGPFSAFDIKW